jgi:pyruvate,orthophosphate dikinase
VVKKWVYLFNEVEKAEEYAGSWDGVRGLLGGKGANLAEMTRIGVPVPPFFTVTTEGCNAYIAEGNKFPEGMWEQMLDALKGVEEKAGKKFGDPSNPLLVSCRSGAKFSMPGMMDTVLNVGLNDETAKGMVELTGNERFVYDSYRRLIQMFGSVVLGINDELFEEKLDEMKAKVGTKDDTDLTADNFKVLIEEYKEVTKKAKGFDFPQDPFEQIRFATEAVFGSWNAPRAIAYRKRANIADDLGTAVNICTMVFGNMGDDSGTGVAFTRDPQTGEQRMFGEYLLNAQGEDVVAGIRNANPIINMHSELPKAYNQFMDITARLEKHYREMQDVEFTIERGELWMLQTRNGKRTAKAAVKIAVDMANEGLISKEEAVSRVDTEHVDTLLHPQFDLDAMQAAKESDRYFVKGVNASPGAAVGRAYFDADLAESKAGEGEDVIMVRPFTKPDDVHGMLAARGILTTEGGATSHAAVVARQFGVPCVVGASDAAINMNKREISCNGVTIKEGDWISVDGNTGEVYLGKVDVKDATLEEQVELMTLLTWADEICATEGIRESVNGSPTRGLQVWANADYPADAERARSYGAKGIGLCRTEHMFFEPERLPTVQAFILAKNEEVRAAEINKLLPYQRSDFKGLFIAMTGLPVIIRLIDPPLHEFMPNEEDIFEEVITMRVKGETEGLAEKEELLASIKGMHESNPMMGLRGVRLSIAMPALVEMQVRAIFEAAAEAKLEGFEPHPEVMIPLTGTVNELKWIQPRLVKIAKDVMTEKGVQFAYKFGTMIEIPRAALTADQMAEMSEFFSFGTNDLTQMTFGYSRDDAERAFLTTYVEEGVLKVNPFQELDREGVGKLMDIAVSAGRKVRPSLEVGICGEHGGNPPSIEFCHLVGNNYVSCSPFRVPVARLAAAHAALQHRK